MKHLLDLLAAVALLVWGTQLVRTGVLRVFGERLRDVLARSLGNRLSAALAGIGVTALVQSSTATALITASFVGQGLIALPAALAVMRGADIGTALMSVLFSVDLEWMSPLFILAGVICFLAKPAQRMGQVGRALIGLGLMLLALRLVVEASEPMLASRGIATALASMGSDKGLEIVVGALLAVASYSSLAIVLLIAAMATTHVVPMEVALGLVLGANLGSGLLAVLAVLTTLRASATVRQVSVGNLVFKLLGVLLILPFTGLWLRHAVPLLSPVHGVVLFHLAFNIVVSLGFIGLTDTVARWVARALPEAPALGAHLRPQLLDPSALASPALAIACAERQALYLADLVETMLRGVMPVIRGNDVLLSQRLRAMDDEVDKVYSDIKYYLTSISRDALDESESQRWADLISFIINLEQMGDIVERVLLDVEHKKIEKGRRFSAAGLAEITALHERLVNNLRLGVAVFLNGQVRDAERLLREKLRFGDMERACASSHLERLADNNPASRETSYLHIDLLSEFKRINSHICSVAYPVLEAAGALTRDRLRTVASQG